MNKYLLAFLALTGLYLATRLIKLLWFLAFKGVAPLFYRKIDTRNDIVEVVLNNYLSHSSVVYSFGFDRSGFLLRLAKKRPDLKLFGVEQKRIPYFLEKLQLWVRLSKIKLLYRESLYSVKIEEADFIYCFLEPDQLQELSHKFKFDCRSGTTIISNFTIPNLEEKETIDVTLLKKEFTWKIWQKRKVADKLNDVRFATLVYVYEI